MYLSEAIQAAGRGLQREEDLATPVRSMRIRLQHFFRAQAEITVEVFASLREHFPLVEAEGGPEPPWEPLWDVVAEETAGELEIIAREAMPAAMETGAAATLADIGISAAFDLADPRAEAYLDENAAAMVTRVNETTRDRIGSVVRAGARAGTSYAKVAQSIVDEFAEMAILKPQRHIRNRAELIAVTELGQAYEESGSIVARQLTRAGIGIEKYWSTTGDDRVSAGCVANQAVGWIPETDLFPSGHSRPLRFPGCRCASLRRMTQG